MHQNPGPRFRLDEELQDGKLRSVVTQYLECFIRWPVSEICRIMQIYVGEIGAQGDLN